MKTESVHPGRWEERIRDEVLALIDDCIRWCNHERIKRSLGWMSPVQYRQSRGMAAWPSPRKRPQPLMQVNSDPLLVIGQYGMGRSAAYASDISPHWASEEFMNWNGYSQLFGNLTRWLAGENN